MKCVDVRPDPHALSGVSPRAAYIKRSPSGVVACPRERRFSGGGLGAATACGAGGAAAITGGGGAFLGAVSLGAGGKNKANGSRLEASKGSRSILEGNAMISKVFALETDAPATLGAAPAEALSTDFLDKAAHHIQAKPSASKLSQSFLDRKEKAGAALTG